MSEGDSGATLADLNEAVFLFTFPPIQSAIKIHGEGGARLILDIAETDLAGFLPALVFRGRKLRVTLECDE